MIDYKILSESVKYYGYLNYNKIEVPWIIDDDVDKITNPGKSLHIGRTKKCLIGSGEQGFLQLYKDKKLLKGRYQTITPCHRVEKTYDEFHLPFFMKNELIITDDVNSINLYHMLDNVSNFFKKYLPKIDCVETGDLSYDLNYDNIELGSYGIREHILDDEKFSWIYGTGCAMPRFYQCINKKYGISR